MLSIRLVRIGKKNSPTFRIQVAHEVLGFLNPFLQSKFKVDKERLDYWIDQGAQLSPAVSQLLKGKYEFKPYVTKKEASSQPAAASSEVPPTAGIVASKEAETNTQEDTKTPETTV